MAFCGSCGAQVGDGLAFCPKCGAAQAANPGAGATPSAAVTPTAAPAAAPTVSNPGMTNNVAGALAYFFAPFGGILFLVLEPYNKDKFVRFHAFQSIFFGLAGIVFTVGLGMVLTTMFAFGGSLFFLVWPLIWIVRIALFGCWLFVVYKAYNKEEFKLPIIGEIAAKQAGQ
jgi:uncharacterized membrane protein